MRGAAGSGVQRPLGSVGWMVAAQKCNRPHAMWARALLARRSSPIGARLALGMGPQAHWTGVLTNVLLGLAIFLLLLLITVMIPQWQIGRGMRSGLLMGMAVQSLVVPFQLPAVLWANRREQALLALLPGTPRGAALNRWFAGRLAALHLSVVVLQMLVITGIGRTMTLDGLELSMEHTALSGLALSPLLTLALWRDWSRAKAPAGAPQLSMFLVTMVFAVVACVWVFWLERPWYELAALTLLVMAPLACWRWRRIERLPVCWPVGRFATQAMTQRKPCAAG
jgi:hypothetical protein